MIPIMITDTFSALRQAAPLDSLFETFCNADSSAVADIEAAASGSLFDHLWPMVVEVIAIMLIVFLLLAWEELRRGFVLDMPPDSRTASSRL